MSQAHGVQDAYMDVGGRATPGAVAERPHFFYLVSLSPNKLPTEQLRLLHIRCIVLRVMFS